MESLDPFRNQQKEQDADVNKDTLVQLKILARGVATDVAIGDNFARNYDRIKKEAQGK